MDWTDLTWDIQSGENQETLITLKTSRAGQLVGENGEVLDALQYLFNLALAQGSEQRPAAPARSAAGERPRVKFQVEGFGSAADLKIIALARRAADEVRAMGLVYRLDPMEPAERKLVHQTLANDPDVETISEGEGPWRKVVVRPREKPRA
jgi:spoIIIJ-associated protein